MNKGLLLFSTILLGSGLNGVAVGSYYGLQ